MLPADAQNHCSITRYSICTTYVEHIKPIQKDLYEYLRENPTYEESHKSLKELAEKYIADLQKKQKAIGDKDFKTQDEIRALKNGCNIQMNTHRLYWVL